MSLGEIDTLNLLTEKLEALFNDSQGYYESFLDTTKLYKGGKLSEKEFFEKLGDYVVAYSALEFLSIKVIFEIKKALDRIAGGAAFGKTHSPGLMPGVGTAGMMGGMMQSTRVGTRETPAGVPPSVVSARQAFGDIGTLPSPDPNLASRSSSQKCPSCGNDLRLNAKFCTKCGTQV